MKKIILLIVLFGTQIFYAQEKLVTNTALITFEASVPFFQAVEAKNESAVVVLTTKTGVIEFFAFIERFQFEKSLMKTHFNDNYLESKKYPKATFKGYIEKFNLKNISTQNSTYYLKGKLTIHGKKKNIRTAITLKKINNGLHLSSIFNVNTDDYGIAIPYIVSNKISKNVAIQVSALLK
jgi:polyisoprenoid-binding protein YceI